MKTNVSPHILPVIVFSQFCCTSLWFAGNAVMDDLVINFNLAATALGHLTSAVQLGFIIGTLLFALLSVADRYSPSRVFLISAILGAGFNIATLWDANVMFSLLAFRFLTGFFLAGIYPVGMKIASDYYEKGLGKSLSFLVGALVLGTAFPHLLKDMATIFAWTSVLGVTSLLAVLGGVLIFLLVPDGPYRKASLNLDVSASLKVFKIPEFRKAAFGYFGHMWELYAFWAFVPILLKIYVDSHPDGVQLNIPLFSFLIIGIGSLACVIGGYVSEKFGTQKMAFLALLVSCLCCLVSPWMFTVKSEFIFVGFLFIWGMFVIADSPLLSSMVANSAPKDLKGTALTIVNSIGFAITIISIQLLTYLKTWSETNGIYAILAIGPIVGLFVLGKNTHK